MAKPDPLELQEKIEKLNYLCKNYHPFDENIPEGLLNIINEFSFEVDEENPYSLTNQILQELDKFQSMMD